MNILNNPIHKYLSFSFIDSITWFGHNYIVFKVGNSMQTATKVSYIRAEYHDSIHYCDSLRLLVNKIVDCLTIQIVISYKIYRKCDRSFMKSEYKGNLTLMILDNCIFLCLQFVNWNTDHITIMILNVNSHCFTIMIALFSLSLRPSTHIFMHVKIKFGVATHKDKIYWIIFA